MNHIGLAVIGLLTGAVSGMFGIGGGILVIPLLVFFFHYSQHSAQGTSLAMLLPPVGIFAVWKYWKAGYIEVVPAATLAFAFLIGAFFGANFAITIPSTLLQRLFGILLVIVGGLMIFRANGG